MSTHTQQPEAAPSDPMRAAAIERLQKKREFTTHAVVYTMVNLTLIAIWALIFATTGAWFPWPVFPILGWGIGLVLHGWSVYFQRPIDESEIAREIERGHWGGPKPA
jgi:fatty acid desaturase